MQIILTTPKQATGASFLLNLKAVLETGKVSVLLIRRDNMNASDYKKLVNSIVPVAQAHNCAVLLDDLPNLVRELNADGVQITTGHTDILDAISDLKPDFIVGAANLMTRHEAMLSGEAGADYLAFGNFVNSPSEEVISLSDWWTNLFEIPCALFDPVTHLENIDTPTSEFLGLGENIWNIDPFTPEPIRKFEIGDILAQ